jgi:carboxyl-terminal processing protease
VLDLRYNGGGLLQIAAGLGYMIAGTQAVGKTFEQLVFNDQYAPDAPFEFQTVGAYGVSKWLALPSLNLHRVFILSTEGTCSASESIINGLRGIGVEVILIGAQTCGKPYGFYATDNCGTTYNTIQFSGVNAQGFGDYSDGFIPSATDNAKDKIKGCELADDFNSELGSSQERLLGTALNFRAQGNCGLSQQAKQQKPNGVLALDPAPGLALDNAWLNSKIIER